MGTRLRQRRSIRLTDYDYTAAGAYFVTICALNRECLFGEVVADKMQVNEFGGMVEVCWQRLAVDYPFVELDEWVVMPNHFHGIIVLAAVPNGVQRPLGRLIGAFKTEATRQINALRQMPGVPIWQRNYYEHIVRHENDLNRIRQYILNNPSQWAIDAENPRKTQ